jgi:pyruvoyl-dependent arginine decarboxylase (PvlArgDC)
MNEVKIEFPAYVRVGLCKECGAVVYAPEQSEVTGEFKRMSACACIQSPRDGSAQGCVTAALRQEAPAEGKQAA